MIHVNHERIKDEAEVRKLNVVSTELRELALSAHDCGMWEEFNQKRHNYFMYDYYKSERFRYIKLYRSLKQQYSTKL